MRANQNTLDLRTLYQRRFPQVIQQRKIAVWSVLCRQWFARYVPADSRVLEVAAGFCEVINNIHAAEHVAVDVNPDVRHYAAPHVKVYEIAVERMDEVLPAAYFDVVFISNFLEHCESHEVVLNLLCQVARVLKPEGRALILGPNFRYCYRDYFDYFDHRLALTEKAVVEALELAGFAIEVVYPRTLPFTFKSHLPNWSWLVSAYIRLRFLWRFFGAQYFVVGRRLAESAAK